MNGWASLGGRRLFDALKDDGAGSLLGHLVVPQEKLSKFTDPRIANDVISELSFAELDPDVVFSEGGLFAGSAGNWKVDPRIAEEFVSSGGVVIVADVDLNLLRDQREAYNEAAEFLGAAAAYRGNEPVVGYDECHFWRGTKQIVCNADDMVRDPWLAPVYEGVPTILAGLPVRLAGWGSILASGNSSSTWSDATDGIPGPDNLPFASVSKRGAGFVALICANVSGDAWLEGSPYNTRWLVNLSQFLVDQAAIERRRLASHVLSRETAFLSHARADAVRVKGVLAALRGEHGLRTWLDDEQLIVGDQLTEELLNAIRGATMFLLFLVGRR